MSRILKSITYIFLSFLLLENLIGISYGIENINILRVFSADEAENLLRVMQNLENNNLNPNKFFNYGYVYHTIGFYLLKMLGLLKFNIDQMLAILILRYISFISYVLSGFLIYKLFTLFSKNLENDEIYGLIVALFLLSIPDYAYWSRNIHPDTLQASLILISVLLAFSKHTSIYVLYASFFAGLAFGTKYSGVFVFPFLFIPFIWKSLLFHPKNKIPWLKLLSTLFLGIMIFIFSWLIFNPYVLTNFNDFISDFLYEQNHVSRGHGRAAVINPFRWFSVLGNEFGIIGSLFIILGFILSTCIIILKIKTDGIIKFSKDKINRNLFTLLIYTLLAWAYLLIQVNMRVTRFTFHILPFMLLIAITGYMNFFNSLKFKIIKQYSKIFICLVVFYYSYGTFPKLSIDSPCLLMPVPVP